MSGSVWDYDVVIIGGGPGGLVASLYLKRFLRSVALISAGTPRAAWIPRTHNLMGFPQGISGKDLLRKLARHTYRLGTERIHGMADIKRFRDGFRVGVNNQDLLAKKVILATGFEDVQPNIDGIPELRQRGLLRYCPVCDAYDYKGCVLSVIAADDEGIQKALFLSSFTNKLYIIIPETLKLAPQRVQEIRERRVKVYRGQIIKIERARTCTGVWIHLDNGKPIFSRAAYIELGCEIRDYAFRSLHGLKKTKAGFLTTTTEQKTSVPGLFAVGDCVNLLGQLSVAAGQAAVAATTIHNDLL